jgi:hypothetical protein
MSTKLPYAYGTKPRFEILDGLRGVAALLVVIFHLTESSPFTAGPVDQAVNHGYLAVDFFFMLSGFVIGYAYDDRWGRGLTQWEFYKRRLIRLQPMVIFGAVFGAMWYFLGEYEGFQMIASTPWWKVLLIMFLAIIMYPTPPSMDIRGWNETSALNGPQWSLMWEYVANILYASVVRRFSRLGLSVFVALAAVLSVLLCCNIDVFGLLEGRDAIAYTVIGGWSTEWDQVYIAVTRLLFPFFGGLLIYRLGLRIRFSSCGFLLCSLILAAAFCMPHIGDTPNILNGLYCLGAILLVFPVVVMAGAGSPLEGRRTIKMCKFLGEISYPLYITHYPLIYLYMSWAQTHASLPFSTHLFVGISIFFTAVGVAYAALKLYDAPVREYLKKRFLSRGNRHSAS